LEYRRLRTSSALDEAFAFLFMDLIENRVWMAEVVGMSEGEAERLRRLYQTKRLCLIRRYVGKFLAEKEYHENGNIKDAEPYCRRLSEATGFVYEPQGFLIDMEPDFYALDYLMGWEGAHVIRTYLEEHFGEAWFRTVAAGEFLRRIAETGRSHRFEEVLETFCRAAPRLPDFSGD
jgi:hypothetical protein